MSTPTWLRLDNSANLWPAILGNRYTTLFRLEARLKNQVCLPVLEKALHAVLPRFPFFQAQIRAGFFWYSLQRRTDFPSIEADVVNPCMNPKLTGPNSWPFRVRVWDKVIACEFSHMLTDGTGALCFMRTLVSAYLEEQGLIPEDRGDLPEPGHGYQADEWIDPTALHAVGKMPRNEKLDKAFHLPGRLSLPGKYQVIHGLTPLAPVLEYARSEGLRLTELIAALYLEALQELALKRKDARPQHRVDPIRLLIPVNLRPVFGSRTMRNFFAFSDPLIDPRLGRLDFQSISRLVYHTLRSQTEISHLRKLLSANLADETAMWKRITPLFIKNIAIGAVFGLSGDRRFSSSLSNLGVVHMPKSQESAIENWRFIPPPSSVTKTTLSLISYHDTLCMSFGSLLPDANLPCTFFRALSSRGFNLKVESNYQQLEDMQ